MRPFFIKDYSLVTHMIDEEIINLLDDGINQSDKDEQGNAVEQMTKMQAMRANFNKVKHDQEVKEKERTTSLCDPSLVP